MSVLLPVARFSSSIVRGQYAPSTWPPLIDPEKMPAEWYEGSRRLALTSATTCVVKVARLPSTTRSLGLTQASSGTFEACGVPGTARWHQTAVGIRRAMPPCQAERGRRDSQRDDDDRARQSDPPPPPSSLGEQRPDERVAGAGRTGSRLLSLPPLPARTGRPRLAAGPGGAITLLTSAPSCGAFVAPRLLWNDDD